MEQNKVQRSEYSGGQIFLNPGELEVCGGEREVEDHTLGALSNVEVIYFLLS